MKQPVYSYITVITLCVFNDSVAKKSYKFTVSAMCDSSITNKNILASHQDIPRTTICGALCGQMDECFAFIYNSNENVCLLYSERFENTEEMTPCLNTVQHGVMVHV